MTNTAASTLLHDVVVQDLDQIEPAPPSHSDDLPCRIYLMTVVLCLVNFTVGFSMAIISPALIFIESSLNANVAEISAIVSFALLGGLLGSILSGVMSDLVGRRRTLEMGTLINALAGIACAFCSNAWQLIIARFFQGFGTSVSVVVAGIILTELAPTKIRGTVGSASQNFQAVGLIASGFVGYSMHRIVQTDECWRHMFFTTGLSGLLAYTLTCVFLLESPRWLSSKHQMSEAKDVLIKIYGRHNEEYVDYEIERLEHQHRTLPEKTWYEFRDLWHPHNKKPLVVTCALKFIQQLTGTVIIVSYMVIIFTDTGVAPEDALLFTALSSVPQLVTMILGSYLLDVLGRKQLLLTSQGGVILTLLFLGFFKLKDGPYQTAFMITGVIVFRLCYSLGMGPVPLVLSSEILPFSIRGRGLALSTLLHSVLGFLLTGSFPVLLTSFGAAPIYFGLCVISVFGLVFMHYVVQDTTNLTLEDIEAMHRILEPNLSTSRLSIGIGDQFSTTAKSEDLESTVIDGVGSSTHLVTK